MYRFFSWDTVILYGHFFPTTNVCLQLPFFHTKPSTFYLPTNTFSDKIFPNEGATVDIGSKQLNIFTDCLAQVKTDADESGAKLSSLPQHERTYLYQTLESRYHMVWNPKNSGPCIDSKPSWLMWQLTYHLMLLAWTPTPLLLLWSIRIGVKVHVRCKKSYLSQLPH